MKKIFTIALCTVIAFTVNAQKKESSSQKFSFGAGPSLNLSMGGGNSNFAIGAELQATYHASANFDGFAQAGYVHTLVTGGGGFVPILVGGRYVSGGFTAGAGIGYGLSTGGGASSGGFAYSPQVGYSFDKFQLVLHYTGVSRSGATLSLVGLKGFYNF